ncbi:MAG: PAS domain S-box protein, partial [Marinobacter sp.]|nr:PAS domain S-box protein [Marinobacter sp.]
MLQLLSSLFFPSRASLILEQAPQAILTIDDQQKVSFFNASAERLWGIGRDRVVGQAASDLLPVGVLRSFRNGEGESEEAYLENPRGRGFWAHLEVTGIDSNSRGEMTVFVRDISEERYAREMMNQTLEQAMDAVISIDEHNNVTFFNKAAETMWGYTRGEVLGHNV